MKHIVSQLPGIHRDHVRRRTIMDFENIEMKEYVQSDQLIGDIIREYPIAVADGMRHGLRFMPGSSE